jgi:hypothetical protein
VTGISQRFSRSAPEGADRDKREGGGPVSSSEVRDLRALRRGLLGEAEGGVGMFDSANLTMEDAERTTSTEGSASVADVFLAR